MAPIMRRRGQGATACRASTGFRAGVEPRAAPSPINGVVNEQDDLTPDGAGRSRAALGLGALAAAGLIEGRFRVLQAEALTRIEVPPSTDAAAMRDAVAAWHVAGSLAEPWVQALVIGGLVAAIAVAVSRQGALRRVAWTLVSSAPIYFTWIGLGTEAPAAELFERTDVAFSRWLQPASVAGASVSASALFIWLLGPLAVRVARPSAAWGIVAFAVAGMVWHATTLFGRGAPPQHTVHEVTSWLVEAGAPLASEGELELRPFGALALSPGASFTAPEQPSGTLHAWEVDPDGVRSHVGSSTGFAAADEALELIDARWVDEMVQTSSRSTPEEPSLITIAVDGLRSSDLAEWLQARTAPEAIQRCAESGVFFPTVIMPTSDPRANEVALLTGDHPASLGRAPIAQHLGASLNQAGFASRQLCEGVPRAGVSGGFAITEEQLGTNTVRAARRFIASHAEERFHLHVSFERLALEYAWDAEVRSAPRPQTGESLDELRELAHARIAERSVRAERHDDVAPLDVEWRAWLDAVHRARTRELLVELDALFANLEAHALVDRTVVVLVGTSGVALGEHGSLGFGQDLHAESVRVPLLVRGPGLPIGERRTGIRDGQLIAGALARICQVAWPGREATWDWTARDAEPRPIFMRATAGVWNGTADREILGLVSGDQVIFWCPAAERDTGVLPGFGPWRVYRLENDPGETVDLALVHEFRKTTLELRSDLRVRAEQHARERRDAESVLEAWSAHGAWAPETKTW
jgi:hypothetical protein